MGKIVAKFFLKRILHQQCHVKEQYPKQWENSECKDGTG
jgi:hypothetical protein